MTHTVEPMLPEKVDPSAKQSTSRSGQILASISVSLCALSAGTSLSWSAPCLEELKDVNSTTKYHITNDEASWAGSLIAIGALFSAIPAGYMADKFGRKNSIISLTIPFISSWIFIIQSYNVWMLYLGRLLAGIGTGAICVLAPMYISEITEDALRGPLCSFFALFLCTGILITFLVATFAKFALLSTILAIFPFLFLTSFLFMPESPMYLIKIGKEKQARKALKFLRGKHTEISVIMSDLKKEIENSPSEKASLIEVISNKEYLRCLVACCLLFLVQQLSGINAVIFYTVEIFEAAKSTLDPVVCSIIVALIQAVVSGLVIFIIDKQGRKAFILQSTAVCCISIAMLGFSFQLMQNNIDFPGLTLIPLVSLMLYIFTFSIGLGPVPWLVLGELLPPEIIGIVSGVAVMTNWFMGFVVTKTFGLMMESLGAYLTFYIFAGFSGLGTVLIYLLVPETKGRTYQEIQAKWR